MAGLSLVAGAVQGAPRVLLWFCDGDALLGTGFPGCATTAQALRIEMEEASLEVEEVGSGALSAADAREAAAQRGAIFVAWVAPGEPGSYVLYAFDSLNDQVLSKTVAAGPGQAPLDAAAVAFLYRNMLGTSLYADLESIESDASLWQLAFPEEKVQRLKQVEILSPPVQPRVHLALGYWIMGYPLAPAFWHAIHMDLGVRVHDLVEVTLDLGGSPSAVERSKGDVGLSVNLVQIRSGVRVRAVRAGPFMLLPGAGAGLGISLARVSGGAISGTPEGTFVHGALYVALLARVLFGGRVGLGLEVGAEALLNYHRYVVASEGGEQDLLAMGRLGIFARFQVAFAM